jgi:hypothetical protein
MANVICHANQPNNLSKAMTLLQNNSYAIAHPDFDDSYSALYDDDGVHLSFIGKDICINTIQEALFHGKCYLPC